MRREWLSKMSAERAIELFTECHASMSYLNPFA